MSRPTKLPRWATGGGAVIGEPSEVEKDTGWLVGYRPPAHWWNWLTSNVYGWLNWSGSTFSSNLVVRTLDGYSPDDPSQVTSAQIQDVFANQPNNIQVMIGQGAQKTVTDNGSKYDRWYVSFASDYFSVPAVGFKLRCYPYGLAGPGVPCDVATIGTVGAVDGSQPYGVIYDDSTGYYIAHGRRDSGLVGIEVGTDGIDFSTVATVLSSLPTSGATIGAGSNTGTVVVVAAAAGVVKSTYSLDGGATWNYSGANIGDIDAVTSLSYSVGAGKFCLTGSGGAGNGIYTSTDGIFWNQIGSIPASFTGGCAVEMSDGGFAIGGALSGPVGAAVYRTNPTVTGLAASNPVIQDDFPNWFSVAKIASFEGRMVSAGVQIDLTVTADTAIKTAHSFDDGVTWVEQGGISGSMPLDSSRTTMTPRNSIAMSSDETAFVAGALGVTSSGSIIVSELRAGSVE